MHSPMKFTTLSTAVGEIAELGTLQVREAARAMPMESHPGRYELLYLHTGIKQIAIGGDEYTLRGGDVLIIRPGEAHGQETGVQDRTTIYYLHLRSPAEMPDFLGMSQAERDEVSLRLNGMRQFRAGRLLRQLIQDIFAAARTEDAMTPVRIRALLALMLCEIPQGMENASPMPLDMAEIVSYIDAHPEEIHSIDALAARCALSPPRFKQKFKEATGVPPAEYAARIRMRRARDLLLHTDATVTAIAMELGFSSSQHFAQFFRRYAGLSPTAFRRGE